MLAFTALFAQLDLSSGVWPANASKLNTHSLATNIYLFPQVGGLGEPISNLLSVPSMYGHPNIDGSACPSALDLPNSSLPSSLLPGVPLDASESALDQEQLMMMMMMEEEQNSLKQQLQACCLRTIDILCVWDCCWCWVRVQELFALLVFDPFMELFITLCIVVNTLFMAMDHDDMDPDFNSVLKNGNLVRLLF